MHFLDRPTFDANDPDGAELLKAVIEIYWESAPARALTQQAGLPLASIAWNDPMEDVWPDLLEKAADKAKLRRLVELIALDNEGYEIFQRLTAPAPDPVLPQPWQGSLFGGRRRPFIDRAELRRHLPVLIERDGARVLAVNGPRYSGRSYSWHLIAHVSEACGEYEAYRIDLNDWAGTQVTPTDLMRVIASKLGWPVPEVDLTAQEDTQVRLLLSWFTRKMKHERGTSWLVFDSLDADRATDAALRLVEGIAIAADRHEAGDLRVILLAYGRSLPGDIDPYILREPLSPVGIPELRNFFESVATEMGLRVKEAALDDLVTRLLGTPPPPGPLPLGDLAPRAAKLAREAFCGGSHGP
jgi:hypothetical protein